MTVAFGSLINRFQYVFLTDHSSALSAGISGISSAFADSLFLLLSCLRCSALLAATTDLFFFTLAEPPVLALQFEAKLFELT